MLKKILFTLSFFAGMLVLASPAFAVALAPTSATTQTNNTVPAGSLPIKTFTTQAQASGNGNMMYYTGMGNRPMSVMFDRGNKDMIVWFGLMVVITVVLVWVTLLLIMILWKQLKKHKRG